MGGSMYGPGVGLGEPTPEGKRPHGWLAWVIGILVWIALMAVVGILVWVLG